MSILKDKIKKLSDIQQSNISGEAIIEIDPDLIDCEAQIRSKDNPGFSSESLNELGDDILVNGQGQPAVVRKSDINGRYILVSGERRLCACRLKNIKLKAVVRVLTQEQVKRIQRSENIQRENLTQLEIAVALRDDKSRLGTLSEVAKEWNKSINWVSERIKFLDAVESDSVVSEVIKDNITSDISTINEIHKLEKVNKEAAQNIIDEVKANPDINIRDAAREMLKEAKASRQNVKSEISRMREFSDKDVKKELNLTIKNIIDNTNTISNNVSNEITDYNKILLILTQIESDIQQMKNKINKKGGK